MKKLFLISVAFIIIGGLILIGCARQKARTEIRVGVVHGQTGMFAAFGQGGVFGIKAAVDDINKQGGVKVSNTKIPIKLIVVDNESDPNKTGSLAESLIVQDKVHFICTGDEPPPMHVGVSHAADRYKIPYITSTGPVEPWLAMRQETPTKWQYTWATGMFAIDTPAQVGDFRAKAGYTVMDTWTAMLDLFGDKTNKKVALIASDEPDGRGWYMLFAPALKKLGYDVVGIEKNLGLLPLETTDFSSIIKQWKDAHCEIFWGNCPGPFFGAVWKAENGLHRQSTFVLYRCCSLGWKPPMGYRR